MKKNRHLVVRIRKRSLPEWMLWLLILLPFSFGTLNGLLKLPWAIRYSLDAAWILLLAAMIRTRAVSGNWKLKAAGAWVLLFLVYTLFSYGIRFQSGWYYLWGLRNVFRFYVAFHGFSAFLKPRDGVACLALFDRLFWVNAGISLVQFTFLGLKGDYLGGLFGTEMGGNGYTNVFMLIVVTKTLIFYLEKQEGILPCAAKCLTALLVAAMAELKFFFAEFVMVMALAFLLTDFTWRKVGVVLGGLCAVFLGAAMLTALFPEFSGWFSLSWLIRSAGAEKGYTSTGDLNRLNAIWRINEMWLRSWDTRLIGLGLGNCENSSHAFLNTPFHRANEQMHYTWLAYAMMYLECGWIGLGFHFGFFGLVYLHAGKIEKGGGPEIAPYCVIAKILAFLCMIISVYNSSMRAEPAYMVCFALSLPAIMEKAGCSSPDRKRRW